MTARVWKRDMGESQEPAAIETTRAQLLRLVDGLAAAPTSST
jgi:hypothetical protein